MLTPEKTAELQAAFQALIAQKAFGFDPDTRTCHYWHEGKSCIIGLLLKSRAVPEQTLKSLQGSAARIRHTFNLCDPTDITLYTAAQVTHDEAAETNKTPSKENLLAAYLRNYAPQTHPELFAILENLQ